MKKEFNITGNCNSSKHYMMDDRRRFAGIVEMVERGKYFVINRPRQYGKTTMLFRLLETLQQDEHYIPVLMSFQGISDSFYASSDTFSQFFFKELRKELDIPENGFSKEKLHSLQAVHTLDELSERITEVMRLTEKKVVLLIDEVDASSNYEPFLQLLAMLRNKYLQRERPGRRTFHSIVLAGVHDIKSLKFKLRNPDDAQVNSPWNIAADFTVVMEFYPDEIAFMLRQYSEAEGVEMDFEAIAERLYYHTSGYPFLVSKLCKNIAEYILPKREDKSKWTLEEVEESVQLLLKENNTNFDSL
ncbi:MAG: AAA family ATPase, partial [Microscillaceae bacterium]|nr:AAA family ATPase [Microscillaceae bacterium]